MGKPGKPPVGNGTVGLGPPVGPGRPASKASAIKSSPKGAVELKTYGTLGSRESGREEGLGGKEEVEGKAEVGGMEEVGGRGELEEWGLQRGPGA